MLFLHRKRKPSEAKFLRQGVQLTGLESSKFQSSVNAIHSVFSEFSRHINQSHLHPWKSDVFTTYPAINIYNRYFYTAQDSPKQGSIPFGDDIDPEHVLATLGLTSSLVHTVDNCVEYFRITTEKK